jgi:prepilin-type N-terminal cleavage/methylation domain-containing protein
MREILKIEGYSLIELLVVIVIVSIITAVALKSLRTVNDTVRIENTKKELDQLAYSVSGDPNLTSGGGRIDFGYVGDIGSMPPNLDALVSNPGGFATWQGPYLRDDYLPSAGSSNTEFDDWGDAYAYAAGISIA